MGGALEGVKVLEFASYITGPYAGVLLADMGAEVIKIEAKPQGDPFRGPGPAPTPVWCSVNRNKKSITLDVKKPEGREIFLKLATSAHVIVENHRPGLVESLGIGYEAVKQRNPGIVYCYISGFGEEGPYQQLPGYDVIGMAMGGLLGLLTDVKNPKPVNVSFGDHLTGFSAGYGILAALYRAAATGQGQKVETSLLQSMVAFVSEAAAQYFATGKLPEVDGRGGRVRQAHCFLGSDGLPFAIHLSSPLKFWKGLTEAAGKPELYEDHRFFEREPRARNYDLLHDILQEVFATAPRQTWIDRLRAHDVPCGPLYSLAEVFQDPQVKSWGLPVELKRPGGGIVRISGNPVRLSTTPITYDLNPPALGEHTEEVLRSLGYGTEELKRLAASGVI